MKKTWIAVVATILLLGLGHLYVGRRKAFAWLMMGVSALSYISYFEYADSDVFKDPWVLLTSLLLTVAFIIDVVYDVDAHNKKIAGPITA